MSGLIEQSGINTPETRRAVMASLVGAVEDLITDEWEKLIAGAIANFEDNDKSFPTVKASVSMSFTIEPKPKLAVSISHSIRHKAEFEGRVDPNEEQMEIEFDEAAN